LQIGGELEPLTASLVVAALCVGLPGSPVAAGFSVPSLQGERWSAPLAPSSVSLMSMYTAAQAFATLTGIAGGFSAGSCIWHNHLCGGCCDRHTAVKK
jgi:hypothetical protein